MPAISKCCLVAVVVIGTSLFGGRNSMSDDQSLATSGSKASPAAQPSNPRQVAEMRATVTEALRASAAKEPEERDDAGRHLVSVLLDLERDQSLPRDERVQLHAQVRLRLLALEKTLRAEQASQSRNSKVNAALPKGAHDAPATLRRSTPVLAQVAGPAAAGPRGGLVGRPGAVAPVGNAVVGQSASPDYGQDLVDLIHAVVQPPTWDINGGLGSVVYFRNYRVLVVTAPSDVHSDVGDLLGQLRK
jgi:hypothetical protein